jgi:ABC-type amino acid transport substrate-binding protein
VAVTLPRRRDVVTFACVFGLLAAVSLLPPDTALRQVRDSGALRVCLPPRYPPLVTGDPGAPGMDVELLGAIAARLGVHLVIVTNPAMGRNFNPRDWHITRAQCDVLAGGVVASPVTRSFLDTTPAYATTGWAWLAAHPVDGIRGRKAGVLVGVSGLDRVALAAYLRAEKAPVTVVLDQQALVQGLQDGQWDIGITEMLLAAQVAAQHGWALGWMPESLGRYPLAFGLWKGDLTLKRAIVAAMDRLRRDGTMAAILARYVAAGSIALDDSGQDGLARRE